MHSENINLGPDLSVFTDMSWPFKATVTIYINEDCPSQQGL